ncbi:MAG: pyridoxal-dependent decarboxylase [Nannocystaceae bacterium]
MTEVPKIGAHLRPFSDASAEAERAGHEVARIYARYLETLALHPQPPGGRIDPGRSRRDQHDFFGGSLGEEGIGLLPAVKEFEREVLPRSMGTPHPMYMGLVNCSPLPAAPLADLLVSAINNNGGAVHQSPAGYAAETELVRAFSAICYGNADTAKGLLLAGGTYANLQGILLARARHFPQWCKSGPGALRGQPRIYASESSHFSVSRSAEVAGLGKTGTRSIPTTGRGAMDAEALAGKIAADKAAGDLPFFVVATAGTTGTGAIDPVTRIADICEREGLWLHVDACYGGAVRLLDPPFPGLDAMARADSIAVDPHKWFFMPITSAMFLCRHHNADHAAFDFSASYLPFAEAEDAYRRSVPSSRRNSALTVWMTLRAHGWRVIRETVGRNIALTRRLEQGLAARGFIVLADGQLSIACARWEPQDLSPTARDEVQREISRRCVDSGETWFATVAHAGQTWLRFNIVNLYVQDHHIDTVVALVHATAQAIDRAGAP